MPSISHDATTSAGFGPHFLQLPYAATVVLMTISTVLHQLVSQAFFVVGGLDQFELYDNGTGIFWSPFALLSIGLITFILLLATTIYYLWPFQIVMPIMAGSARVVLEACCQLKQPLPAYGIQWGDISTDQEWKAASANA
jgi:hypothetical protein